jgi:hypothetical protein
VQARPGTVEARGGRVDLARGVREALWRAPDTQPAVAESRGAREGRVGASADDHRDRLRRPRPDPGAFELEELARVIQRLAGQQPLHDGQRLVGAPAAGARVDAAHGDLVAILAADADAEDQLARRRLGHRGELSGDGHRMAQREQVDADADLQALVERGEGRRVDESVHPGSDMETHVVGHEHVIDACVQDLRRCAGGEPGGPR